MIKETKIVLSLLILLSIGLVIYLNQIKESGPSKGSVTGEVASANLAISISVVTPPTLTLILPENKTYLKNQSIKLNFSALNADSIWYNLDSGANITLTGNTSFNTTEGIHTLYLFANNTQGNASKNVTFTLNSTRFIIKYNNYSGLTAGASTNFNESTYEDIQNLSDIILENTNYGKIKFNEKINITNDLNSMDNEIDLDSYTKISFNFIEINTTELPNFNKSATLSLYNLTFNNPRILRNGVVCPPEICTKINYSGGVLVFNVTHFTNYSAEETPSETITTPPSGGGGGGITTKPNITKDDFILNTSQIKVSLNPMEVKTVEIKVTNNLGKTLRLSIKNLLSEFIVVGEEDSIVLNPAESKVIPFYIIVKTNTVPDLYLGKILIKSLDGEGTQKEILVSIEVESKGILLDVKTEVLNRHKKVLIGDELLSEIKLFNLGSEKRKDISIEYIIKNYEGNEIFKQKESLAIETQLNLIKRIPIPEDTKLGKYILYVRAIYDGDVASASDNFEVVSSIPIEKEKLYILIAVVLLVILSWIIYHKMVKKIGRKRRH